MASVSATEVLTPSVLVRLSADGLWNRSSSSFYRFWSAEASALAYWSLDEARWLRARVARNWVRFSDREVGERFTTDQPLRRDGQWRLVVDGEWAIMSVVTLTASAEIIRNRTNDPRELFDFLNYTQGIYAAGLSVTY